MGGLPPDNSETKGILPNIPVAHLELTSSSVRVCFSHVCSHLFVVVGVESELLAPSHNLPYSLPPSLMGPTSPTIKAMDVVSLHLKIIPLSDYSETEAILPDIHDFNFQMHPQVPV